MDEKINITIDGGNYKARENQVIVEAAKDNGIYIPTLCYLEGMQNCLGTCRVCTVKSNGHYVAGCTSPVQEGISVEVNTPELIDFRKALIEMLFVEGNHLCPSCEKSGDCDLQALAYRFNMLVPRFPFKFNNREIDMESSRFIVLDHNRCILCKRCVEIVKTENGEKIFAFQNRGSHVEVHIDPEHGLNLTSVLGKKASEICPVGAILHKGKGFDRPIGSRKYDKNPIGHEIESKK
jgi:[NiFe] hydrogenase diaphorase moiety small subunit